MNAGLFSSFAAPRIFAKPGLSTLWSGGRGVRGAIAWFKGRRYANWAWRVWAMAEALPAPNPGPAPQISLIVPVYNSEPAFLEGLLQAFLSQAPGLAELVLADDGSDRVETQSWLAAHSALQHVQVLRLGQNQGIARATNAGLEAAKAPWIGLVDHDDLIAPHGVKMILRTLEAMPEVQFLYTDEVIAGPRLEARSLFLKPGFDPVLLSGLNYVNHLSVYRRDRLLAMGGLDPAFEGSQDYELVLRYCQGLEAHEIAHLPYPAYICRQHAESFSHARLDETTAQARTVLARHYAPEGGEATVGPAALKPNLHRVDFPKAKGDWPRISIIIPNRDSPDLVRRAMQGVLEDTDYPDLELIVIDNGSTDPNTLTLYEHWQRDARVRVEIHPAPFNFSAMVNRGADLATGEHLLLLNNDIEVETPDWLKEMVSCLDYPGTGIVGAKLLFPDRRIQHAGVILGQGDLAGHWFYKQPEDSTGPMERLAVRNGMTVVTGAVMLISSACWQATGRFDEEHFRVAYNDVDYCARARAMGFGVVWTPHAQLIHHEGATRGRDDVRRNSERFQGEQKALRERHATVGLIDPYHSPWLSRFHSRPLLRTLPALPAARHFMGC